MDLHRVMSIRSLPLPGMQYVSWSGTLAEQIRGTSNLFVFFIMTCKFFLMFYTIIF
jgi:hypothetical protein